ncbi:MAG: hypothetical protein CBC55_02140 [Gammaproteobacteria bacterium TMED95]|nr:MAG: hypothetical protein CBC55_02140 [Gammaproteobacteria bacterium TMED95]|tara:strand:- start:8158 stop:8781 length:624 start_codon:yes stop_codon:yes gene_type:complete
MHQTKLAQNLFANLSDLVDTAANSLLRQQGNSSCECIQIQLVSINNELANAANGIVEDDTRPFPHEARSHSSFQNESLNAQTLASIKDSVNKFHSETVADIDKSLSEIIKLPEAADTVEDDGMKFYIASFVEVQNDIEYKTRFLMTAPTSEDADTKLHHIFSTCRGDHIDMSDDVVEFEGNMLAKKPFLKEISKQEFETMSPYLTMM